MDIVPTTTSRQCRSVDLRYLAEILDVTLTIADEARLAPHLVSYRRLNEILLLADLAAQELKLLILLEMKLHRRTAVVRKLVGRLKSIERRALLQCLNPSLKVG